MRRHPEQQDPANENVSSPGMAIHSHTSHPNGPDPWTPCGKRDRFGFENFSNLELEGKGKQYSRRAKTKYP